MVGYHNKHSEILTADESKYQTSPFLIHSKRHQRCRTIAVPIVAAQATVAPVVSVEVDTPTYLEVPDFQRVAIIGDYASGVLFSI